MLLSEQDQLRYSRQIKLTQFGRAGQARLLQSRVLIIGAGGLGCPVGLYLAGAGVGFIGIVDCDRVHISNLHRQVAFNTSDAAAGAEKAKLLAAKLQALNSSIAVAPHVTEVRESNVLDLIARYDLVIDGTDNFATKFLIADGCYLSKIPLLAGAVHAMSSQISLFVHGVTPCYRCLFPAPPTSELASCADGGILGSVAGTAALFMSTEAIKFLSGLKPTVLGNLLVYDGEKQTLKTIATTQDQNCSICSSISNTGSSTRDSLYPEHTLEAAQLINVDRAKQLIDQGASIVDIREQVEFSQGTLPGAICLPLSELIAEPSRLRKIETAAAGKPIILFCKTGARSRRALEQLPASSAKQFYSLTGGLDGWFAGWSDTTSR